jgi:hypothetical protein
MGFFDSLTFGFGAKIGAFLADVFIMLGVGTIVFALGALIIWVLNRR